MVNSLKTGVLLCGFFLALGMAGCALPISEALHREANSKLNFTDVADNPAAYVGNIVIWGGTIQTARNTSEGTEIQILQSPLRLDDSPDLEATGGEFIAITEGMLDLNILKKGEKITVGGSIVGERIQDTQTVKFRYPVLLIKEFYLWDKANKWGGPRPSSGWFWESFGAGPQPTSGDWQQGNQESVW